MDEPKPPGRGVAIAVIVLALGAAGGVLLLVLPDGTGPADVSIGPAALPAAAPGSIPQAAPSAPPESSTEPPTTPAPGPQPAARAEGPSLSGRVLDDAGRPIAGANVTAVQRGRREPLRVESRPDGTYRLDPLEAGEWFVRAEAADHVAHRFERLEVSGPTTRDLVLVLGASIRGVVTVEGSLTPIAGAWVTASGRAGGGQTRTAPDGTFRLGGLADGEYRLGYGCEGYLPALHDRSVDASFVVSGRSAAPDEFVLELSPGGAIEGRVFDPGGNPAAGALVFGFRDGRQADGATADENGRYRLAGLAPGTFDVFARSADYEGLARSSGVDVASGDVVPGVDLVLEPGAVVEGFATVDAVPAADLVVQVLGQDGQVRRNGRTGGDGRFEVGNLYPGRYRLSGRREGEGDGIAPAEVSFEVRHPGERLRIDLDLSTGASFAGVVLGPAGPVPGAMVYLLDGERYVETTRTDEAGRFRLGGLAAGAYDVYVRRPAGRGEAVELLGRGRLELADREMRTGDRLDVSPSAHATGRLLAADGTPVAGAVVEVTTIGPVQVRRQARTAPDGSFRIDSLYDGEYGIHTGDARDVARFEVRAGRPIEGLVARLPGSR